MKLIFRTVFLLSIFTVVTSCNYKIDNLGFSEEGKGSINNKTYNVNFDELEVSNSLDVVVLKSSEEKVVVSAPSDIINKIVVENTGKHLKIGVISGSNISTNKVKIKVYAKDFSSIDANSSAFVKVKDRFTQDKMEVNLSSSAEVNVINLEANDFKIIANSSSSFSGKIWAVNCNILADSSADVDIEGKSNVAVLEANSSGTIDGKNFLVASANVNASSSAYIAVVVSSVLKANASSSGSINILKKGNLQSTIEKNSGGDVTIQ